MPTIPLSFETPTLRHSHIAGELLCPTCDQPVSSEKFEEIRARERERIAILEREYTEREAQTEAKAQAEIESAKKEAASTVEKGKQELAAREAALREEATKAAMTDAASKLAEAAETKRQFEALKASHEGILNKRLQEQNEAKEKEKTEAVNAERSKAFEEKLKLEEKLQDMTRQLQKKRADELGEGAEIDLFEDLRREFPGDEIRRVKKGEPGADIIHKIVHFGKICGTIIYDSKNRARWLDEYATKLRRDQLAEKADHAVLSTLKFPGRGRQIHIRENVLIANPARVLVLAHILRKHIVQIHVLRLSNEARNEKSAELYDYMRSEPCTQYFQQIEALTTGMLDLDVEETKAHQKTCRRRGDLIRTMQKAHGEFSAAIDRIVGTTGCPPEARNPEEDDEPNEGLLF